MRIATICAITLSAGLATVAIAQDAHAGHAGHDAAATKAPEPMAGMDHGAAGMADMPGMDHGSASMQGMDHGAMMHMAPAPKGINRPSPGPAEAALQGFVDAIEVGNRTLAIEQLAANASIVEDGEEESRAAYIGHHLGADMLFAKTVKSALLERRVEPLGKGRARILSRTRMVSNRADKPLDMIVSETATMVRVAGQWRIERLAWVTEKQ